MFLEFLPDYNHSREYKEEKDNILTSRSLQSRKEVYNHIHYVKYVFSTGKQLPGQSVAVHLQLTEAGTNQDKPVPQAPSCPASSACTGPTLPPSGQQRERHSWLCLPPPAPSKQVCTVESSLAGWRGLRVKNCYAFPASTSEEGLKELGNSKVRSHQHGAHPVFPRHAAARGYRVCPLPSLPLGFQIFYREF